MKQLFLALILFITILGCDDTKTKYEIVCEGVECSEHGECTVKEDRKAVCVCDKNFHAEGLECKANTLQCGFTEHEEAGVCVSNHKMLDCIDITPSNATTINIQTEIIWENGTWSNASNCEWYCNENYHKSGNTCVENTLQCEDNQHEEENGCVDNTKTVNCNDVTPEHGVKVDSQVQITWENGVWSNADNCDFTCETGYNKVGGSCVEDNPNNHAPTASNVIMVGTPKTGETLTLNYDFHDEDGDSEGASIIAWSTPTVELQRGTSRTFIIPEGYVGDKIGAWVHPVDEHGMEGQGYAASNNTLIISGTDTVVCEVNSCTEAHKTVCSVENNQILCSCDSGYHEESGNCVENNLNNIIIGARPVESTPLSRGTKFASPTGSGSDCTEINPCSLQYAVLNLVAGDVLFLRGGNYLFNEILTIPNYISGTENNLIIIESYPNEVAVLDGQQVLETANPDKNTSFWIRGSYIKFRKLEIKGMYRNGIYLLGDHLTVEGCEIHHNLLTGVGVSSPTFYQIPYEHGYNLVIDNKIHHNSDVGITGDNIHDDGDNGDGVSVSSGKFNKVIHNEIYDNSDDGVDTWKSNDTEVAYNLVYNHGKGLKGNGGGIKLGGEIHREQDRGKRGYAHHNVVYNNRSHAFNLNAGREVIIEYNTSYHNGMPTEHHAYGNLVDGDVIVRYNISFDDYSVSSNHGMQTDNSWQRNGTVEFISTDPDSPDFLKPVSGGGFEDIGAYAHSSDNTISCEANSCTEAHKTVCNVENNQIICSCDNDYHEESGSCVENNNNLPITVPIWIIGDSTVCNYAEEDAHRGWGQVIKPMFKNPERVFNFARSGASSKSFKPTINAWSTNRFWGDGYTLSYNGNGKKGLKQVIIETDTSNGGYLLIQFGHNDSYSTSYFSSSAHTVPNSGNEFDDELMEYINFAKLHNVTPVLITPMVRMFHSSLTEAYAHVIDSLADDTPEPWENMRGERGDWPQTMRDMAQREELLLIDLTAKSKEHFTNDFSSDAEIKAVYSWNNSDFTHFNQRGAQKMADFIKELACNPITGDAGLCNQFNE